MKRNKFRYQTVNDVFVDGNEPFDFAALKLSMKQHQRGELLVRKEIDWDVAQMRKFFHGPVRAFILAELRKVGFVTTADQIKDDFKLMFGPKISHKSLTGKTVEKPKSTADYSFDDYLNFLNRINEWSVEKLKCELPPAEQVE